MMKQCSINSPKRSLYLKIYLPSYLFLWHHCHIIFICDYETHLIVISSASNYNRFYDRNLLYRTFSVIYNVLWQHIRIPLSFNSLLPPFDDYELYKKRALTIDYLRHLIWPSFR
jgi:hypothetical protein